MHSGRVMVFGRMSPDINTAKTVVRHEPNVSVSHIQCQAVEELLDQSPTTPADEAKHLKIEKLDYSDEREIEIFLPKHNANEENKKREKILMQEMLENQARINTIESNIKK